MSEETKVAETAAPVDGGKKRLIKNGDGRAFVIALLTSLIVLALYHAGMTVLRCRRGCQPPTPAACQMPCGPGPVYVLMPLPGRGPEMQCPLRENRDRMRQDREFRRGGDPRQQGFRGDGAREPGQRGKKGFNPGKRGPQGPQAPQPGGNPADDSVLPPVPPADAQK